MLGLVFLLTVTIGTILPINEVECDPLRDIDVDDLVHALQRQISQEIRSKPQQVESSSSEDDNSEDNSRYGALTNQDIIQLIRKASQDSHKDYIDSRNTKEEKRVVKYNQLAATSNGDNDDRIYRDNDRNDYEQALNRVLLQFLKEKNTIHRPRKAETSKVRLVPNDLLQPMERKDLRSLNDYSKIYVILNPLAIKNSENRNTINELLSKVLSMSSQSEKQYDRKMDYRYKGFPVKHDVLSRRVRRDSKEMYAPKDTMEDDYKPKRARSERGGGNSGRTSIPYIRQRGDIYERDN